jgi:hypothetical protein
VNFVKQLDRENSLIDNIRLTNAPL